MDRQGPKPIVSLNLLIVIISKSNITETMHTIPQVTRCTSSTSGTDYAG